MASDNELSTRLVRDASLLARYQGYHANLLADDAYNDLVTPSASASPPSHAPARPVNYPSNSLGSAEMSFTNPSDEDKSSEHRCRRFLFYFNFFLAFVFIAVAAYAALTSPVVGPQKLQFDNSTHEEYGFMTKNGVVPRLSSSTRRPFMFDTNTVVSRSRAPDGEVELSRAIELKLANVSNGYRHGEDVVPLFWEVSMSGGGALTELLGSCLGMVQASNLRMPTNSQKHYFNKKSKELKVTNVRGKSFVAVDTDTVDGVEQAVEGGLVSSGLADVIVSHVIYEATSLFTEGSLQGQIFTLLRHPIDRAVSMYDSHRENDPHYFDDVTLEMYAESHHVENNWLTRLLTNRHRGGLTEQNLKVAKEILRRKCVIGLFSDFRKSVDIFEHYFGWQVDNPTVTQCQEAIIQKMGNLTYRTVKEGSRIWTLLMEQNRWDMQLYTYASQLFDATTVVKKK